MGDCTVGLSACDLAYVRGMTVATLKGTATILRETRTADDMGGQQVTWEEVATDVPCRIVKSDLRFVQQSDRVATVTDTRVVLDTPDVEMGDKLLIDNHEFRVESLPFPNAAGIPTTSVSLWRP